MKKLMAYVGLLVMVVFTACEERDGDYNEEGKVVTGERGIERPDDPTLGGDTITRGHEELDEGPAGQQGQGAIMDGAEEDDEQDLGPAPEGAMEEPGEQQDVDDGEADVVEEGGEM